MAHHIHLARHIVAHGVLVEVVEQQAVQEVHRCTAAKCREVLACPPHTPTVLSIAMHKLCV